MAPMDISGVMPNFKNPDHFTRSNAGIFFCTLCPLTPKGDMPSFKTPRAALAHEQSSKHVESAEVDDTWDMKPHDWPSEPLVDTSWMDPEQVKDVEHRQRIQEIPQLVGAWRSSCAEFMRDGTMLPVETPPNPHKVKRMKKALKAVDWKDLTRDDSNEVSAAEEAEPSSVSSGEVDHMAVRARAMTKAKAIRAKERAARALVDHAKDAPEDELGVGLPPGASLLVQPAYGQRMRFGSIIAITDLL